VLEGARVAVVVPAWNEELWIGETVASMPAFVDHILVVDDASRDRTAAIAAERGGSRTRVVRHAQNRGVGAAIATGYRSALEMGAEVIAVMAGDGQMHPDDLEPLARAVARGEADYAKGDRLSHPGVRRSMPFVRRVGTAAFAFLTRHAAGLPSLADSQCGFTAISARALASIDLDALWTRYGYPNDLIGALARAGMRVVDVPVRPVYRGEASGLRPWHAITIGYVVARVAYRRIKSERPLPFVGRAADPR
jgi:glycosyltransferase involved in cell wall biosynthesis